MKDFGCYLSVLLTSFWLSNANFCTDQFDKIKSGFLSSLCYVFFLLEPIAVELRILLKEAIQNKTLSEAFCSVVSFLSCFVFSLLLPFPVLKLFLTVRLPLFFFILPQGVYFHASNPKDFIGFCWDCSREEGFARSDCMVLARVHSVLRST